MRSQPFVNKHAPISKKKFTNSTIMKSSFVDFNVRAAFGFSVGEFPFWSSSTIVFEQSSSSFIGGDDESWDGRSDMINLLNGISGIIISGSIFFLLISAKAPNFGVSLKEVFLSSLKNKKIYGNYAISISNFTIIVTLTKKTINVQKWLTDYGLKTIHSYHYHTLKMQHF